MKKIFFVLMLLISTLSYTQSLSIIGPKFVIKHNDLTFYLDADTNSFISVHTITQDNLNHLTGKRKDKWHKESPYGPYKKSYYVNTGYDLGHLTPSKITMYDSLTNYHSFSFFNQAPQVAYFNEHPWEQLESNVVKTILKSNSNAIIISGVLYDNNNKTYLNNSRIKIPIDYYKIVIISNGTILAWLSSNINGIVSVTDVKTIIEIAKKNGNNLDIKVTK